MADEQIYSMSLKRGKAVAFQYTDANGEKHRAIVPTFKTASGKPAPVRRQSMPKNGKTWIQHLNRGWDRVVQHVQKSIGA